jgi:hypothetical protein
VEVKMDRVRRRLGFGLGALLAMSALPVPLRASAAAAPPAQVIDRWYRLILELVRHTPTYSPPVASRAFAYLGVIGYEALASGDPARISLAGQLTGLTPPPARSPGLPYDDAVALQAALADATASLFGNTGPTGQRAIGAMTRKLSAQAAEGVSPDVTDRSAAHGRAIAAHVLGWAATDGGAVIENLGFPYSYTPKTDPGAWVPTSRVALQQAPLLPSWGRNRAFAMPAGDACPLPPPPAYSEDPASAFYAEALEVYEVSRTLTDEQRLIARFWSDDPMLSPTPPGHWLTIALDLLDRQDAPAADRADLLMRLGVTVADAFIACWASKYDYDLLRPVTYIRRTMDPKWEPLLITPPFPEYPSGHSTQSGAAAAVLTATFGEDFSFEDHTHVDDGLPVRTYPSFHAAAEEAALSRLYGGIHFRSAIARGLDQGRCVGAYAVSLRTRA